MPSTRRPDDFSPFLSSAVLAEYLSGSSGCLVGRIDAGGVLLAANSGLRHRLGPASGPTLASALTPEGRGRWSETLAALDEPGRHRTVELPFGPGSAPEATFRCLVYRDEGGAVWLFGEPMAVSIATRAEAELARRVAQLERARADAEAMARIDPLTGLANRRQVDLWLEEGGDPAARERAPSSCLMIDLDHFKEVNDDFGHRVGDHVLGEVGRALAAGVRAPDRVARHGGDEFVVFLPDTDLPGAIALADRLRATLAGLVVPPLDRGLTASFGVAGRQPGDRAEALRDRADAALLRAKRGGRNRVETA